MSNCENLVFANQKLTKKFMSTVIQWLSFNFHWKFQRKLAKMLFEPPIFFIFYFCKRISSKERNAKQVLLLDSNELFVTDLCKYGTTVNTLWESKTMERDGKSIHLNTHRNGSTVIKWLKYVRVCQCTRVTRTFRMCYFWI